MTVPTAATSRVYPAYNAPTERNAAFTAFIRRLAEWQARALSGDREAKLIVNQFNELEWHGHRPSDALALAEIHVRQAERSD